MKITTLASIAAIGMVLAAPAHAARITGTVSFSDGFDVIPFPADLTCIVNCGTDTYNINNSADVFAGGAGSATLDFLSITTATASDLDGTLLPFAIYEANGGAPGGFTFTVTSYSLLTSTSLTCDSTGCRDSVEFSFFGSVVGAGFSETVFSGIWTGNGTCIQDGNTGNCLDGSQGGTWSASITASGQPVPAPAALALLGLGLAGFGFARRS